MEKWQDPNTLALWFGIILLFVLVLVISIILLVRMNYKKVLEQKETEANLKLNHQQALLQTSFEVQERERDRIASDLHDELIGKLTAIRLKNQVDDDTDDLDHLINDTIVVARRITHDLSPPLIDHTPFTELIEDLIAPWQKAMQLEYNADVRNKPQLSTTAKIQMTRIIQEVMTNISKHSNATQVKIQLRQTLKYLILRIEDNGKGINFKTNKKGLGLKNIESRMQYIGGKYRIRSQENIKTYFLFFLEFDKLNQL